ncbi:hypothetical protein K461DRAFT_229161 [Myriangium duriaei CBS 260.36]|uniref:HTH TFE/IIEalpha-type domain-containing protein n=1 Tax=Myriangium duriaei CBS 260.36 TaxID=1168546 RepID=A0A9P4IXZ0_9PEZI|nr:hypothetical protein K461DRAFT_229161 [Myriangium duriaei CBS 260.36]
MDLAKTLVRTIVRGFYTTEYVLIIDALAVHSTLTDADLAHVLGMQTKALRRLCGKLKEDGLINVQSRGEKKEGAPPSYFGNQTNGKDQQPKERLFYRDWYFINFHRAIDSIKYRMWKLNRHIESQGAPTAEKKDLICPRCKSTYTELEVMDNVGAEGFYCHRCDHLLESQEDTDGPAENESMKRMNDQLSKILSLMRTIDSTTVPENDFDTALRYHLPVERPDSHPGARTTVVDDRKPHIASSKGLAVAPEKVSVNLTESRDGADKAADAAARAEKREREAKQNALPEWISKSTLTGDVTTVGAKEEADRRRRELEGHHDYAAAEEAEAEDKKRDVVDNAVMDDYWKALKAEQERERREEEEGSEDEDEDEEDDFEDVEGMEVKREASPAKKPRLEEPENKVSDTDDDDDDDELEFEDV